MLLTQLGHVILYKSIEGKSIYWPNYVRLCNMPPFSLLVLLVDNLTGGKLTPY